MNPYDPANFKHSQETGEPVVGGEKCRGCGSFEYRAGKCLYCRLPVLKARKPVTTPLGYSEGGYIKTTELRTWGGETLVSLQPSTLDAMKARLAEIRKARK